jgi:streptogramin lyase/predicted Ser/Thr protein kinase
MRASEPHIGSDLLGYEIEEVIGRGGMGVVYRARDRALERNVALKLIAPEFAGFTGFRGRFLEESRLAASLEHPNVVPIYAAGDQDGHLYIAMRYIEGQDLKQVLRDGVLEPARAIAICRQVASALDAAHGQGLVHRDVKPSNILLDTSDRAYLADFGLSRLSSEPATVPEIAASLGTVDYVAPEQIRGDAVDGRADVYSLGCVLYECLTGITPFSDRSDVALLYAHLEEEPPAPHGLEQVIAKALAKDPGARYATSEEFVEAAADALGVSRERRVPWATLTVAAVIALIAGAVIVGSLVRARPLVQGAPLPVAATSTDMQGRLIQVDPNTQSVQRTIPIGTEPAGVAAGASGVWAASYLSDVLWNVDPTSGAVTTMPTDGASAAVAIAAANRAAYAVFDDGGLKRFVPGGHPPVSDAVLRNRHAVANLGDPTQVATGRGGVWGVVGDTVYQVKPLPGYSAEAVHLVPIPAIENDEHVRDQLSGLAVGKDAVWVIGDVGDQRLWRIDISRHRPVPMATRLHFAPADVAVGFGHVWVTGQITNKLYEIDPDTGRILQAIKVGREPMGVAVGDGAVWVANAIDGTITKFVPDTGATSTIPVDASPTDVSVGDGSVWVAADAT